MFNFVSSPKPRLRHGRRLAFLSRPNLTLNLYTFFFALLLDLHPHLPPLLTSPTVPLPENLLRSMPIFRHPIFLCLRQRPCVAEPEATFPSSAEPRSLRSLIFPSVHSFTPLNFLRLSPTFSPPLPLAQTKLPIPCYSTFLVWHGFSSHFQSLLDFAFLSFHLEDIFHYSHPQDGKAYRLSCFLPVCLSYFLRIIAV